MPHQPLLRPYWEKRSHFSVVDELLLYDECIVIPRSLRLEILNCIHTGHLGITKCRARAQASEWWPGLSMQIKNMVANCRTCAKSRPEPKEPLVPTMATRDQVLPVNHTSPKVSTPVPENLPDQQQPCQLKEAI